MSSSATKNSQPSRLAKFKRDNKQCFSQSIAQYFYKEDECNLKDEDGAEGFNANTPLKIDKISQNMDDILVSTRKVCRVRSKISSIDEKGCDLTHFKTRRLERKKLYSKTTAASSTSFKDKTLRDEIRGYLKMGDSARKSKCNMEFNFDIKSKYVLQSKLIRSHLANDDPKDDFVTMNQIHPLE